MSDRTVGDERDDEAKQTTPTGVEIPVPKREDFLRDLKKAAPTVEPANRIENEKRRQ